VRALVWSPPPGARSSEKLSLFLRILFFVLVVAIIVGPIVWFYWF
jgi:hypothetical protein